MLAGSLARWRVESALDCIVTRAIAAIPYPAATPEAPSSRAFPIWPWPRAGWLAFLTLSSAFGGQPRYPMKQGRI